MPEARTKFIRKTYIHLAFAILDFIALEYVLLNLPGIEVVVQALLWSWLVTLGLFIDIAWLADRWARSNVSRLMQYAGLAVYVVTEAIIFLPLMYVVRYYSDPTVIPAAGILTLLVFAGLTTVAFTRGVDFSFLRGILVLGAFLALGLIVASLLFGFTLGIIFSVAMVGLAGAFILYETSNVLRRYRTDQYVSASVALMFYYILMTFVRR